MLTIDTIGTKTILQFPNKKYFQTSENVIGDCLRISDNIDSTPNTATIFVLEAAGWGSVKYPSNNERPLGPLFLASFPTRDWVFCRWWLVEKCYYP